MYKCGNIPGELVVVVSLVGITPVAAAQCPGPRHRTLVPLIILMAKNTMEGYGAL